jgi:hypothetical protein
MRLECLEELWSK